MMKKIQPTDGKMKKIDITIKIIAIILYAIVYNFLSDKLSPEYNIYEKFLIIISYSAVLCVLYEVI